MNPTSYEKSIMIFSAKRYRIDTAKIASWQRASVERISPSQSALVETNPRKNLAMTNELYFEINAKSVNFWPRDLNI
jgi:flagellar basal body rod protein FlgG